MVDHTCHDFVIYKTVLNGLHTPAFDRTYLAPVARTCVRELDFTEGRCGLQGWRATSRVTLRVCSQAVPAFSL